ncbi:uncharacterized protein [Aegilops tauschii subsp. strangulata]
MPQWRTCLFLLLALLGFMSSHPLLIMFPPPDLLFAEVFLMLVLAAAGDCGRCVADRRRKRRRARHTPARASATGPGRPAAGPGQPARSSAGDGRRLLLRLHQHAPHRRPPPAPAPLRGRANLRPPNLFGFLPRPLRRRSRGRGGERARGVRGEEHAGAARRGSKWRARRPLRPPPVVLPWKLRPLERRPPHRAPPGDPVARMLPRRRVTAEQEQGRLPMRATDAVNEWRLPKVSEEEDDAVDQKDCQDDTMSCSVSSARDWNFWSDSVYEGPAMKHKENAVHAKLVAWKDSQIVKLIYKALMILLQSTRLNQKDRWQKNKIARPGIRDELTETEEQEQGRLPTREDLVKCFSMPRNIRLQTPRHPSLLDMRVDGSNRGPPKFVHKATPARLMRRARSSHNYHGKRMEAITEKGFRPALYIKHQTTSIQYKHTLCHRNTRTHPGQDT